MPRVWLKVLDAPLLFTCTTCFQNTNNKETCQESEGHDYSYSKIGVVLVEAPLLLRLVNCAPILRLSPVVRRLLPAD